MRNKIRLVGFMGLVSVMVLMLSGGSAADQGTAGAPVAQRTHEPIYCGWVGPVWVCVP